MIIRIPSLNGGGNQIPKMIVIHAMAEEIQYKNEILHASKFLEKIGLSAHALIDSQGNEFITRPANKVAYHAKGHNLNSIGIEFLVPGCLTYDKFLEAIKTNWTTPEMINTGIIVTKKYLSDWSIDTITRHCDIDPERKEDPGTGFPYDEFIQKVRS